MESISVPNYVMYAIADRIPRTPQEEEKQNKDHQLEKASQTQHITYKWPTTSSSSLTNISSTFAIHSSNDGNTSRVSVMQDLL
jgi:hypothetical protein